MVRKSNDTLQAALGYAAMGLPVFPCHSIVRGRCTCGKKDCGSPGKHPATANGFRDATTDRTQVEAMFAGGNRNIGVPTGAASGFWVLDLDGSEGVIAFQNLQNERGRVAETPLSITGGGGQQLFFKLNGAPLRNTTKLGGKSIDVRGEGGYVIVPPSKHASGKGYVWGRSIDDTPLAEAPDWLIALVTGRDPRGGGADVPQPASQQPALTFTVAASLGDHSGVSQGARHDTAKRLIGAELAAGTPVERVAELALAFAGRCSPPMDQDETLRLVSDLHRKRAAQVESKLDEIELVPLPESTWPTLEPAAYYGLAGEIVRAIEPCSEADPAALLVQLLVMFGSLIGRSAHFIVEGTRHFCNLFASVVGATSRGRKGTGGDRVKALLQLIDDAWGDGRIQSGLVSGEGLVYHVRDPVLGPDKKTGQLVVVDPGVTDKRLMIVESEFASVLRAAKRETNTLSPTLRAAWDGGNLGTLAKNSACKATGAHVSLIGHITHHELVKTLAEVEIFSGLGNRILWVAARRSKLLPSGGGDLDLTPFVTRLAAAHQAAKSIQRMRRDADAERLWERLYSEFAASPATGLTAAVTSRAEAQTLRLSMIYALFDGSAVIGVDHLRAATAVWRYCEQTAFMVFGRSTGNTLDDKLLALIRATPGINRRDLHRGLSNNTTGEALAYALAGLRDAGQIRVERDPATGGRPAECYFPVVPRTNEQSPAPAVAGDELNEQSPNLNDGGSTVNDPPAADRGVRSFVRPAAVDSEENWQEVTI